MGLFDRKPVPSHERTTEERERARAERESRRAAREGRPVSQAVPPPLEVPPQTAPAVSPAPAAEPPPPAPPAQPPPPAEPPPPALPAPAAEPPPAAPPAQPPPPPAAPAPAAPAGIAAPPAGSRSEPLPARPPDPVPDPEPAVVPPAAPPPGRGFDAPSVVLDSQPVEDWSALDSPPAAPPRHRPPLRPPDGGGRAPAGRPLAGPAPRGPGAWALAVAALVAVVALLGFLVALFQPLHGPGRGRVSVTIPRGATVSEAGRRLADRDVISSTFLFRLRAKLGGAEVKPGTYPLPRGMSYGAALDALAQGPPKPRTVDITITEGRTRREVSRLLAQQQLLRGSYAAATVRSPQLNPRAFGAPPRTPSLEGFLFPATYQVRASATVGDLVRKQLTTFRQRFATVDLRAARRAKLTPYDVLIIASMVEREAMLDRERPLVASVIYNRLREGIPLGIDATIRYATGNYTQPLRQSELAIDSPYNTRTRQGLPPTPIGNPGLASIRAAARPARTGYLYFVVKPGACGEHAFSSSDAQFQRDAQRYSAAREAKGGRSPVKCN